MHVFHTNNDSDDSDGEINHGDKAYRLRLTKALACLGVKPSNFNALVVVDKYDEVEQLLKEHLIRTTHEFQHRYVCKLRMIVITHQWLDAPSLLRRS